MVYCKIEVLDTLEDNLLPHFDPAADFIRSVIEAGKGVLVRCSAGVSRSTSVVIAYLMKWEKLKYDEAFRLVQSKRQIVDPNPSFVKQLKQYEQMLTSSCLCYCCLLYTSDAADE
eukprot:TRINITY_DN5681_c0_g1_i1.p1 TRINITY_DN5681_c0_g1~~TRINITY_DN5681_c0_g1_i1.p1  ORF type:complete len:115 (-),score=6.30 TRINITY_DN5681_c0_g1_i1:44-388(-)